jgi:hypothetical protein
MSLAPQEGRIAIVTDVGAGCSGRNGARRRTALMRTVKSCGPDAPTLASSSQAEHPLGATVANQPGHRGEHEGTR